MDTLTPRSGTLPDSSSLGLRYRKFGPVRVAGSSSTLRYRKQAPSPRKTLGFQVCGTANLS